MRNALSLIAILVVLQGSEKEPDAATPETFLNTDLSSAMISGHGDNLEVCTTPEAVKALKKLRRSVAKTVKRETGRCAQIMPTVSARGYVVNMIVFFKDRKVKEPALWMVCYMLGLAHP